MPKFYYKARDRKGVVVKGSLEASNTWLARKELQKQNLIVLEIGRFSFRDLYGFLNSKIEMWSRKVTAEEQLVLMNQLETGFSVGIPIIQMLNFLKQDLHNKYLQETLKDITEEITQGSTIHAAFAKHDAVFNSTVVSLIKTGELTGKLDEALLRITKMIEQQAENRAKVMSAMFYPKIVLFVMVVVLGILVYFIIPKLKAFLAGFGADLPAITQFVMAVSDFFVHRWYVILATIFGVRYLFKRMVSTEKGKYRFDLFKLKMPVLGKIFLYLELNNLCVILELLISSGIPLMEALETLKETQQNEIFKRALTQCQKEVSSGGSLTKGFEGIEMLPATFKNLFAMGEESGRMQPVLLKLGRYYQIEIDYRLNNLSKLIEPILLFFIFIMVLIIALAVFLPIWKINSAQRVQ